MYIRSRARERNSEASISAIEATTKKERNRKYLAAPLRPRPSTHFGEEILLHVGGQLFTHWNRDGLPDGFLPVTPKLHPMWAGSGRRHRVLLRIGLAWIPWSLGSARVNVRRLNGFSACGSWLRSLSRYRIPARVGPMYHGRCPIPSTEETAKNRSSGTRRRLASSIFR